MARYKPTAWLDCHAKLTNRELRALYRGSFDSVAQLEIVLYILSQTRGTGRIMAGELQGAGWDEWETARDTYGRDAAPLFRGSIAAAIQRHEKHVARELRRLIAAGVVIEHEPGRKGKAAVLSVDLDPTHWDRLRLSGASALPNKAATARQNGGNGSAAAPKAGSAAAPESAKCGSADAPRFKRPKSETEEHASYEAETSDSGESDALSIDSIQTPRAVYNCRQTARQRGPSPHL